MTNSPDLGLTRRTMLKATAATTAGAALFTGTASASDDTAFFTIECIGPKVRVTLKRVEEYDSTTTLDPADLTDLQVFLGTEATVDKNSNGRIDRSSEILPCFRGTGSCPDPVAFPLSQTPLSDGSVEFVFDRAEAGLDAVSGQTSVVIAGVYNGTAETFDSLGETQDSGVSKNVVNFDPAGCCTICDTGTNLLVKYEWMGDKFEEEEGSDSNITLKSVKLDEDNEPEKACFKTSYCSLWAVVKAGTNYDLIQVRKNSLDPTEFCVEPSNGKAISNIQFFCKEPSKEDYELGNSDKSDENGNKGNKGNNGKKK